jgi:hypothetical protein
MSKSGVLAYLASCHSQQPVDFKFDSFRATVSHALGRSVIAGLALNSTFWLPAQVMIVVNAKRSDNRSMVGNARLLANHDIVAKAIVAYSQLL